MQVLPISGSHLGKAVMLHMMVSMAIPSHGVAHRVELMDYCKFWSWFVAASTAPRASLPRDSILTSSHPLSKGDTLTPSGTFQSKELILRQAIVRDRSGYLVEPRACLLNKEVYLDTAYADSFAFLNPTLARLPRWLERLLHRRLLFWIPFHR